MKATANTLKDEKLKTKKTAGADKTTDKKVLTRKPDGLSVTQSRTASIKASKSTTGVVKNVKAPLNKKNVMNTIHNVTVASPPTSASKQGRSSSTSDIKQESQVKAKHDRTRTRTIDPNESILHRKNVEKQFEKQKQLVRQEESVKEPVAFEINFEEAKKPRKVESHEEAEDDYNYESDFESYESDFEPEVPSSSASSEKDSDSSDEVVDPPPNDKETREVSKLDKERIDSGSFEMSTRKQVTPLSAHYDSIDDTINSHDSGISYEDLNVPSKQANNSKTHELYKRGLELMKKITFDELNFNIFEAKPIPYEAFMSLYGGQINMFQVGTQSESMMAVDEAQTETVTNAEMWTQFPAKFTPKGLELVNTKLYNEEKLGVGEGIPETKSALKDESEPFSNYFQAINDFSKNEEVHQSSQFSLNSTDLHKFVENAALTILNVIDNQSKQQELKPSKIPISRGFTELKLNEVEALRDTITKKLYTSLSIHNIVVTVHKKNGSDQHLICLWDVLNTKRPMKIFSSWSEVTCLEIHDQHRDVIVGGCSDGTICLWDAQEFSEWRDEHETTAIIKPCEVVSLNQTINNFALENVVALKSLPNREMKNQSRMFSESQSSQICSLHKNGSIVIWTISRTQVDDQATLRKTYLDFLHIKSRVRLVKNFTIHLNKSVVESKQLNVKTKSAFERTRYYFENDLFSDKVLRELQEIDTSRLSKAQALCSDDELMKFNDCDVSINEILVASDMNFILAVSRLSLGDQSRKLFTNDSSCIAPSALKIHPVNKNVLAIGQTNGEVKFVKLYDDENVTKNPSLKHARKSTDTMTVNDLLAKSCAFQNIVEKEKKLYDETQALNNLESDELKAFLVNEALSEQFCEHDLNKENLKISLNKNIFNSFEVSSGPVKLIEFNKNGEFMLVLIEKQLRIFNCWKNSEVEQQEKLNVSDAKCVQGADSTEYLVRISPAFQELVFNYLSLSQIILTTDNLIHINKLRH